MEGIVQQCVGCRRMSSRPRHEFDDLPDVDDPGVEPDHAPRGPEEIVCIECYDATIARFARPESAFGRGTLGDFLVKDYGNLANTIRALSDPDVQEVLPRLHPTDTPEYGRMERSSHRLAEALRLVGSPVCVMVPDWADEEEGPFLLAMLNETGGASNTPVYADYLLGHPEVENAHDYAPDGSPLA